MNNTKTIDWKGVASVAGVIVAITSLLWNKIDGCIDRSYNRKLAETSYSTLAKKVDELTVAVVVMQNFMGIVTKVVGPFPSVTRQPDKSTVDSISKLLGDIYTEPKSTASTGTGSVDFMMSRGSMKSDELKEVLPKFEDIERKAE